MTTNQNELSSQSEIAVRKLLRSDVEQLYEQIGIRTEAIRIDPTKAGFFDPAVIYDQAHMGAKESMKELGKRIYNRWKKEAFDLACGNADDDEKERQNLASAFGISDVAVAASLSALIVTNFGVAPAIAAVIAALIVKRFFRPAFEEFCLVWRKHLDEE